MSMNQDETPVPPQEEPLPPSQAQPEYPAQQQYGGYAEQGGAYAGPPPARAGFDLRDLYARWRSVLYPPRVAPFDAQKSAASWNTIWISLVLLGIVQSVFAFITGFEYHKAGTPWPGLGTILGSFIGVFFAFFIGAGLIYLLARMLGGTGDFLVHSWLLSLVWVPIQAISAVVGVIPFLGGVIQFALAIYSLFLYTYATASAHRITLGRAAVAVFIPGLVMIAIVLILLAVAAAFLIGLGLSIPGR